MLLALALSAITALLIFSIVLNLRDWHWRADIETVEGLRKFRRLGYERIELERRRNRQGRSFRHKGYMTDDDYITVPLDAPLVQHHPAATFSLSGSNNNFDMLRVIGWKDGQRHTVYIIYYTKEICSRLKALVDKLNQELQPATKLPPAAKLPPAQEFPGAEETPQGLKTPEEF